MRLLLPLTSEKKNCSPLVLVFEGGVCPPFVFAVTSMLVPFERTPLVEETAELTKHKKGTTFQMSCPTDKKKTEKSTVQTDNSNGKKRSTCYVTLAQKIRWSGGNEISTHTQLEGGNLRRS